MTVLAACAVAATFAVSASAAPLRASASVCGFTVKGAPWASKGQRGTAYTVIAEGGASCSTAKSWVPRLTRERAAFTLKSAPSGWHCSTLGGITTGLTMTGQCTTSAGGIVEWLPKLKK